MRLSKVEIHKRAQKEDKFINEWKMAVTYLTGKKGVEVKEGRGMGRPKGIYIYIYT
jgi:hypothetical protein